jgi:hypothetical protein
MNRSSPPASLSFRTASIGRGTLRSLAIANKSTNIFSIFSIYYDEQTQEKTSGELAQWWQEGHHETHQSSADVRNR